MKRENRFHFLFGVDKETDMTRQAKKRLAKRKRGKPYSPTPNRL